MYKAAVFLKLKKVVLRWWWQWEKDCFLRLLFPVTSFSVRVAAVVQYNDKKEAKTTVYTIFPFHVELGCLI